MEVLILIGIMAILVFFGVLHAIIKSAVRSGLDHSKEIQVLKNEIQELNKRLH